MPFLTFKDGTTKQVEYSVAASIKDIQEGRKTAVNDAQAKYANLVTDISFSDLPAMQVTNRTHVPEEHDTEMDKIINNKDLTGRNKLKAVVDRIKARRK